MFEEWCRINEMNYLCINPQFPAFAIAKPELTRYMWLKLSAGKSP